MNRKNNKKYIKTIRVVDGYTVRPIYRPIFAILELSAFFCLAQKQKQLLFSQGLGLLL